MAALQELRSAEAVHEVAIQVSGPNDKTSTRVHNTMLSVWRKLKIASLQVLATGMLLSYKRGYY